MVPSFWGDAEGVILVYDVTRPHTLEACANWYGRLLQSLGKESLPGVLVANKMDLRERLVVKRVDGQQMASQLGMEVSSSLASLASLLPLLHMDSPCVTVSNLHCVLLLIAAPRNISTGSARHRAPIQGACEAGPLSGTRGDLGLAAAKLRELPCRLLVLGANHEPTL